MPLEARGKVTLLCCCLRGQWQPALALARRFWLLHGRSLALRAGASSLHWEFSPRAFNCLCPAVIGDWNSTAPTAQAVVQGKAEGRKRWESGPLPWV